MANDESTANETPSRPSKRADVAKKDSPKRPSARASAAGGASSSKKVAKVARAARSGRGKRSVRERPKLAFPLAIFVICVLGVLSVAYARGQREAAAAGSEPPKKSDHFHIAYGIYVCDHFLTPYPQEAKDTTGIHTHGDGIMHTHPFTDAVAGFNARLKVWAQTVGMKLTSDSFSGPDGTVYSNGYMCGDKPAKVYVYRWADAFGNGPGDVFSSRFPDIRLKNDKSAITFAVVPEGMNPDDVPKPESVASLNNLSDVAPTGQATTDAGPGASTSLPSDLSQLTSLPGVSTPEAPTPGVSTPGVSTPGVSTTAAPVPSPAPAPSP